jgi:hypothetical protein
MTRVLVCGGRDYDDWRRLHSVLQREFGDETITIIEGGAIGADFLARVYAKQYNLPHEQYPADWAKDGKAGGSIRNQRMLDEGRPDYVIAFPGRTGTADMVRRAKKARVPVIEVKY